MIPGGETKFRIAETAMGLFLEQGYDNVTVEAVAEASNVSRRTVFRHFGGKDELAFPDHSARIELLRQVLAATEPGTPPVEAVITATRASLTDFLRHPELILRRFQLTRVEPELRRREVVEHQRYLVVTRGYLREHRSPDDPPFLPMAAASLVDAMHRSALGDWTRSGGTTDALADLEQGFAWVRRVLGAATDATAGPAALPLLLAVLPDSPEARSALSTLRETSRPL